MPIAQLSVHFFLQAALILLACRLVSAIGRRLGQSQAVCEMIAGVALGPSLLGLLWPQAQLLLFPKETQGLLYTAGQFGVGLYMFLVGTEFRAEHFRQRYRSALAVSISGIAVPFMLALALVFWLHEVPGLFAAQSTVFEAWLFLGAAIAITAFPMLARIIHEQGLADTSLGTLALTAGAMDDAAAWCILAVVLASFNHDWSGAWLAIGGGVAYAVFVTLIGRRLLRRLGANLGADAPLPPTTLAVVLALFCLSAWFTDAIGIHAVFGGFLLGTAMPKGELTAKVRAQLQSPTVVFLLPMFFVYSGLNTRLDLVTQPALWMATLAVLAVSFIGKGGACYAAARLAGGPLHEAKAIGALMNARGLMELLIINIGLQAGMIGAGLFSILVLMAILSTLLATPLFNRAMRQGQRCSQIS